MTSPLRRVLNFLVHGGTAQLRPFERLIVERAAATLPEPDRASLLAQLERIGRVQRFLKGRQVNVFMSHQGAPSLANTGEATVLSRLQLRAEKSEVTVSVLTHRGYLSSLEFNRAPGSLAGLAFVAASLPLEAAHVSPTSVADRLEHGRQ
jgi:hypothetical protein